MQKSTTRKTQLLLLDDVDGLGRSGDVVTAKPGFIRNYLLPEQKAVVADKHTLRIRARLQEERAKRAEVDRKVAEEMAGRLSGVVIRTEVKVDPEGHMYGSVSTLDVAKLLQAQGYDIERKMVLLPGPLKTLGLHTINLRLKEGVPAQVTLEIYSEGVVEPIITEA